MQNQCTLVNMPSNQWYYYCNTLIILQLLALNGISLRYTAPRNNMHNYVQVPMYPIN